MITKACTNHQCRAYAHFVYTVATRCVFCRSDLKSAGRFNDLFLAEPGPLAHEPDPQIRPRADVTKAG